MADTTAKTDDDKLELLFTITVRGVSYELDLLRLKGRETALVEERTGKSYNAVLQSLGEGLMTVPAYLIAAIAVGRTQNGSIADIVELYDDLMDDEAGVVSFAFKGEGEDAEPAGPTKSKPASKPRAARAGA